jgi:hypothetical protein
MAIAAHKDEAANFLCMVSASFPGIVSKRQNTVSLREGCFAIPFFGSPPKNDRRALQKARNAGSPAPFALDTVAGDANFAKSAVKLPRFVAQRALKFFSIPTSHYSFNFKQKVLFDQSIDDEQGVGWIGLFAVYFRKISRPQLHELFNVLRMDEIGRELYNILEIGVYPLQYSVKVIEDLAELALKIVPARDFAVFINGELPGDEIQRSLIHSSSM